MDIGPVPPDTARADAAVAAGSDLEETWLLGQPSLRDYLDFVRDMAVDAADPRALCDEWRRANDHYHDLEVAEAGIADKVERRDLDPASAALAEALGADPHFRNTFDLLPTTVEMVELDRLVVWQLRVTATFVRELQAQLGPAPDPEALFRFCLPVRPADADVKIRRLGSRRYAFSSESTDLRFHGPELFGAGRLRDHVGFGPVGGVLGLVVGFGSNLLSAIRADDRLLLQNGYHRACALRALGVTHAPCVVQTVTRRDELAVVGPPRVVDAPAFYFKAARPPLLKDFFDPRIRKPLRVRRTRKVIEVSFEVREAHVAE